MFYDEDQDIKTVEYKEDEFQNQEIKKDLYQQDEEVKTHKNFKRSISILVILVLIGSFGFGSGIQISKYYFENKFKNYNVYKTNENTKDQGSMSVSVSQNPVVMVVENVGKSVVAIRSQAKSYDGFLNEYTQEGLGSGVIFNVNDQNILILTNNHVVEGSQNLIVTLDKDKEFQAKILGVDKDSDLAVIKIEKNQIPEEVYKNIKPVVFGDSDQLRAGETAIAIGNPLGYSNTVTQGVISAVNRDIKLPDKNLKVIQTDAAINPGNSGGALTNIDGELIGINTIKIADTKVEGIGFAIPINYAKPIINDLVKQGYVSRPFIGIVGREVTKDLSELYEIPIGVIVVDVVDGGSAKKAGIKKGDVIISLEDKKIMSMDDLTDNLKSYKVGDSINLTIIRDGNKKMEKKLILQDKNLISN